MVADGDPLLKDLPPRGSKLGAVDEDAAAEVDAREAVGEEEKAAAAAVTGANAFTASGRPAFVRSEPFVREMPKFEHALDPKAPPKDETNVYSEPVAQTTKLEEWKM